MDTEEKHKCPPHHFRIDSDDVGHCIYCPEVRDFRKLQEKEARRISRSHQQGAMVALEALRKGRKRFKP